MILLDLFSGYGGFHLGLQRAGFEFNKIYFSEIEKNAIANYNYNFRNEKIEYIGAVESVLTRGIERPHVITFGSPCQSFSAAGQNAGLDGESGLIRRAIQIIRYFRPDVYIWENVKGVISRTHRRDFFKIIKEFADIGGYELEGRLLNTLAYLPQNRERYFVVGRLAERCRCRGEIFPLENTERLSATQNAAIEGRAQAEFCTTIKQNFGNRADNTYILQTRHGFNSGGKKEVSPTISKSSFENNNFVFDCSRKNDKRIFNNIAPTIKEDTFRHTTINQLRKFTEIELERLQGLPDNWTKYGIFDGVVKEISATQRYKLIGNGVSIPVVEAVGKLILKNTEL